MQVHLISTGASISLYTEYVLWRYHLLRSRLSYWHRYCDTPKSHKLKACQVQPTRADEPALTNHPPHRWEPIPWIHPGTFQSMRMRFSPNSVPCSSEDPQWRSSHPLTVSLSGHSTSKTDLRLSCLPRSLVSTGSPLPWHKSPARMMCFPAHEWTLNGALNEAILWIAMSATSSNDLAHVVIQR